MIRPGRLRHAARKSGIAVLGMAGAVVLERGELVIRQGPWWDIAPARHADVAIRSRTDRVRRGLASGHPRGRMVRCRMIRRSGRSDRTRGPVAPALRAGHAGIPRSADVMRGPAAPALRGAGHAGIPRGADIHMA